MVGMMMMDDGNPRPQPQHIVPPSVMCAFNYVDYTLHVNALCIKRLPINSILFDIFICLIGVKPNVVYQNLVELSPEIEKWWFLSIFGCHGVSFVNFRPPKYLAYAKYFGNASFFGVWILQMVLLGSVCPFVVFV